MPPPDDIPDGDDVSRLLFAPSMGAPGGELVWDNVFMFKTDRNYCESVVWRHHAPALINVHNIGCEKQAADRAEGRTSTYFGALTGRVGRIREIRSKNGARFQVVHVPEEGVHHAHIAYLHDAPITKNDKAELKKGIRAEFAERSEHTCPE